MLGPNIKQSPNWIWLLGAAIVCAIYFRLASLGTLGYWMDEDIQTLAIKGILDHGYPEMPSGMIYIRSTWFLYVQAASAKVFGLNEFALRLPAAISSIAAVVISFFFARRLFGTNVALIVAWAMAFAFEEIVFGRVVRMYAPLMVLYLATVYLFYVKCVATDNVRPLIPTIVGVLTVLTHTLGFTLAFLYLFPIISGRRQRKSVIGLIIGSGTIIVSFLLFRNVQYAAFGRAEYLYGDEIGVADSVSGTVEDPSVVVGVIRGIVGMIDWPELGLLQVTAESFKVSSITIMALLFVFGIIGLVAIRPRQNGKTKNSLYLGVGVPLIIAASLHQLNVVLILLALVGFARRRGIFGFLEPENLRYAIVTGVLLIAWFIFGMSRPDLVSKISDLAPNHGVYRELADFPHLRVVWGFLRERPISFILAVLGMLWCVERSGSESDGTASKFILYVFVSGLFITGLFESLYDYFRYILHFDPYFIILAAIGLLNGAAVIRLVVESAMPPPFQRFVSKRAASILVAILGVAAGGLEFNPIGSWYAANRDYGEPNTLAEARHFEFYPDFRGPAQYVLERKSDSDIIIVLDSRETYNYLGHVDFWITTHERELRRQTYFTGGVRRDKYVNTAVISTMDQFEEILTSGGDRVVWLLASDRELDNPNTITREIAEFIRGYQAASVFLGGDGDQRVYRIDPSQGRQFAEKPTDQ